MQWLKLVLGLEHLHQSSSQVAGLPTSEECVHYQHLLGSKDNVSGCLKDRIQDGAGKVLLSKCARDSWACSVYNKTHVPFLMYRQIQTVVRCSSGVLSFIEVCRSASILLQESHAYCVNNSPVWEEHTSYKTTIRCNNVVIINSLAWNQKWVSTYASPMVSWIWAHCHHNVVGRWKIEEKHVRSTYNSAQFFEDAFPWDPKTCLSFCYIVSYGLSLNKDLLNTQNEKLESLWIPHRTSPSYILVCPFLSKLHFCL